MKYNPNEIAVTVVTFYPKWYQGKLKSIKHTEKIRGDLALEFLQKAQNMGFQAVISDGKSSKSFKKALSQIPNIYILNRRSPSRAEGKRKTYKFAAKLPQVKVIVTTEPEKVSILDSIEKIARPILQNSTDIVVPKREEKLFRTSYPLYQYQSETEGNSLYNETLKTVGLLKEGSPGLDIFFGPRAFSTSPKIVSLFTKKFNLKLGKIILPQGNFIGEYSDTLIFPILYALKKGLRVQSVEIPFTYPNLQKENEEVLEEVFAEKRRLQRLSLLLELAHFINFIEKKK